ncbi:MAG: ATP-binding protein [Elusimicrobiota bacterium]
MGESERSDAQTVSREAELIRQEGLLAEVLDAFPEMVLILDGNRQIIHCNKRFTDFMGVERPQALGKRPGEVFGCIHSCAVPAGCGASRFCVECGAARSILRARKGEAACEECRMTLRKGDKEEPLDLRVWSVPLRIRGQAFIMTTLKDIADEKRRQVLQHTFFCDVLNDLTVIAALAEMSLNEDGSVDKELMRKLLAVCRRMGREIQGQRDLELAEIGQLTVDAERFDAGELVRGLVESYVGRQRAVGRSIALDLPASPEPIETDRTLLGRVLGDLLDNALEATPAGGSVEVRYRRENGRHVFRVRNPGTMPESVRLQVFQRSFSTKGAGRGIGTYDARFLTETYLRGKARFESDPASGTSFFVELP